MSYDILQACVHLGLMIYHLWLFRFTKEIKKKAIIKVSIHHYAGAVILHKCNMVEEFDLLSCTGKTVTVINLNK